MNELMMLYQEIILDHGKKPRFCNLPEHYDVDEDAFNPLCGDRVHLYLSHDDSTIQRACFQGQGCAISMASTSLMLEAIQLLSVEEANILVKNFLGMILSQEHNIDMLGKLKILQGVKAYPSRIKCATLAWHALEAILKKIKEKGDV